MRMVGIDRMPYCIEFAGFSSIFIFADFYPSIKSFARSSTIGPINLHGPHHFCLKSQLLQHLRIRRFPWSLHLWILMPLSYLFDNFCKYTTSQNTHSVTKLQTGIGKNINALLNDRWPTNQHWLDQAPTLLFSRKRYTIQHFHLILSLCWKKVGNSCFWHGFWVGKPPLKVDLSAIFPESEQTCGP